MAQRKLTMRKIKEVLRLKWVLRLSDRQVGASLKIAHSTVGEYIKRAERAGLDWPQVEKMEEAELRGKLFPPKEPDLKARPQPGCPQSLRNSYYRSQKKILAGVMAKSRANCSRWVSLQAFPQYETFSNTTKSFPLQIAHPLPGAVSFVITKIRSSPAISLLLKPSL